ncbi:hypothetical protein F5B18DRAFT_637026, partial [Nemania serpens]
MPSAPKYCPIYSIVVPFLASLSNVLYPSLSRIPKNRRVLMTSLAVTSPVWRCSICGKPSRIFHCFQSLSTKWALIPRNEELRREVHPSKVIWIIPRAVWSKVRTRGSARSYSSNNSLVKVLEWGSSFSCIVGLLYCCCRRHLGLSTIAKGRFESTSQSKIKRLFKWGIKLTVILPCSACSYGFARL